MARKQLPTVPGGGSVPVPDMSRGVKAFIEGVIREMRRVVWPSLPETARLTATVLIVCVVFVIYLWAAAVVVDTLLRAAEGQRINLFG